MRALFGRFQLALVAVLMAWGPAVAAAPSSPFSATIYFHEDISTATAPCLLQGQLAGGGVVQGAIGAVTFLSTDCINAVPPNFVFASPKVVLTTTSGDQIFASYGGVLSPDGTIAGGFAIYGGTGIFAHAKGAGFIQGAENLAGDGYVQLEGTIRY